MYQVFYSCLNIYNSSSPQQNKSVPANGKRAVPRKEDAQTGDRVKKQRSSAGPVKVAVVLTPIGGKSSNLKTNHKTAANDGPRNDVQEVPKHEATECVETPHPSEDAHEESVEDQKEGTGNALMTEVTVDEPRNPGKVSIMTIFICVQTEHLHL